MTATLIETPAHTPAREPGEDLSRFSPDALIDAIIRLTHRIESMKRTGRLSAADVLREQRSLARAELIRRATS